MFKRITQKIKNSVIQKGHGNLAIFKSKNVTVNQVQAMEQMQQYLQKGEVDNAVDLLRQMKDFLDSQHPCAPFWKYEFGIDENGKKYRSHVPAFPGADIAKPLNGTMKVVIPSHYKKFKNMKEMLDFSYVTQQEIELDLINFKAWIGETIIDEFEAHGDSKSKVKLIPNKFPPPTPMKLYLRDNTWSIDYLLVGVEKILDSTIIFSNANQKDAPFTVELIIDINLSQAKFNITITETGIVSVKNILKFIELLDKSKNTSKPKLALKLLESDTDLIIAQNWDFNKNGEPDPEDFISFLKKINYIEDEFNLIFRIPNHQFTSRELYLIDVIYASLTDNYLKRDFKGIYNFELDNQYDIERLLNMHDETNFINVHLNFTSNEEFDLLGIKFKPITYLVYLENVKLDKPHKLRMKSTLLDDGESLKVKLLPYNTESYISEKLIVEPIREN